MEPISTKVEYSCERTGANLRWTCRRIDNASGKGRAIVAIPNVVDWDAIIRDSRFQGLHRRKVLFLWGLMALSVVYYFLLPIGAAYYQDLFRVRVWGVVNVGLLFALSEFVVAWAIALVYSRKASQDFDRMAEEIAAEFGSRKPVRQEALV
jgi:uncharacterized membrane protein (DUF485 family)